MSHMIWAKWYAFLRLKKFQIWNLCCFIMKIFNSEASSESQKMRKRVFRDLNALESILEPNWIKREFQPVRTKIFYIQCLTIVCSRDFNLTVLSVFDMLGMLSTQKIIDLIFDFSSGLPLRVHQTQFEQFGRILK